MAVEYTCVGCGKKKKFRSRDHAASQGWKGCRIGNAKQFCQCGCMTAERWRDYITEQHVQMVKKAKGGQHG